MHNSFMTGVGHRNGPRRVSTSMYAYTQYIDTQIGARVDKQ